MANPLKILTALSASSGVAVSGSAGLKVQQGGLTVDSGTTAVQALTATTISGSSTLQAGGAATLGSTLGVAGLVTAQNGVTVTGAALNASAVAVSASALNVAGAATVGGDLTLTGDLKVTGNDIKSSTDATALTLDGANVTVAGDLKVGGNDIKASDGTTAITLVDSTGDVTVAGDLKVGGNDIKASNNTVAISLSGADVTIAGNLTVRGTTTTVDSTTVNIGDKNLNLGTGSSNLATLDGGGLDLGTNAEVQFRYDNGVSGWTSNKHINLSASQGFKIGGTTVLTSTQLGAGVTASSLTSLGTITSLTASAAKVAGDTELSGAVLFKSDSDFGGVLSTGSLNNLTGALGYLVQQIMSNSGLSPASAKSEYQSVRYAQTMPFPGSAVNRAYIWLAAADTVGQSKKDLLTDSGGATILTGSAVKGLSGSTEVECLDNFGYASLDVITKASGTTFWTNDLISVQVSAQQSGSFYYPLVTVDAPGLGEGNGNHQLRLIVINEVSGAYDPQ